MFSGIFGVVLVFLVSISIQKICEYFKDLRKDVDLLKLTPEQRRSIEWEKDLWKTDGMAHWQMEKDGELPSQTDPDIIEFDRNYG